MKKALASFCIFSLLGLNTLLPVRAEMDTKSWGLMEPPSFYLLRDATFVTEHWKEALVITGVPLLLSKTI